MNIPIQSGINIFVSHNALCHTHKQLSGVPLLGILPSHPPCKCCAIGKMPGHSFPGSNKRASCPLALVHTDLARPMPIELCSHAHYILTFHQ